MNVPDPTPTSAGEPPRRRFRVSAEAAGGRLDRVLTEEVGGLSRARFQEMIVDGRVRVDGVVVGRPGTGLEAGSEVEVELVPRDRTRPGAPEGAEFQLLHEDEAILVIAKPAGMVVHPSDTVRGGTLSERLAERWPDLPSPQGEDRPGIVHRLDAETSGVLVVARTAEAAAHLMAQFKARTVQKVYAAIVNGWPRFDADWIEEPLGRHPRSPERVSVVSVEEGGRKARTFYTTLERLADPERPAEQAALLSCEPKTGRTHQIRAHLEAVGHPVVGDKLYRGRGRDKPARPLKAARHLLHAAELEFEHPVSGERVRFRAPLPPDFEELLARLRP